jgi:hypothetical protein
MQNLRNYIAFASSILNKCKYDFKLLSHYQSANYTIYKCALI